MGRPPCCDKVGIKKGPWTPEEDIILVSYIQEHGPGNWRSVPTNTGLLRCSKSCRLRWTNYLRPGIKRGNFTPHEEGMIIHLQALLGNKWAAIASYLPQRTDNDIKNYWNTHLKKKLRKFQSALDPHSNIINMPSDQSVISTTAHHQFLSNRNTTTTTTTTSLSDTKRALDNNITSHSGSSDHTIPNHFALKNSSSSSNNSSSTYASSTENISRLLEGWMKSSPKANTAGSIDESRGELVPNKSIISEKGATLSGNVGGGLIMKTEAQPGEGGGDLASVHEEFESILSFEGLNNNVSSSTWERSSTCGDDSTPNFKGTCVAAGEDHHHHDDEMIKVHHVVIKGNPPLSFLEKWLLDETSTSATAGQVEEMMELSPMF